MTRAANFVEETTTSIAGTSGNGAVTMSAITNRARFSSALGSGAVNVRYVIEKISTGAMETGIGSVASNVLTRTTPLVTWDGSTYSSNAPSALQFGSAPTSGDVLIRIAAVVETMGVTLPGTNLSLGNSPWRDYPITAAVGWDNNGSNNAVTLNREYYSCYELSIGGNLQGIQFEVGTLGAGNMKFALYSVGANGLPGTKIVDFNVASVGTTGIKTDTTVSTWTPAGPILLSPGWYYIGFIASIACNIKVFGSNATYSIHRRTPLSKSPDGYGWANTCYVSGNYTTGLPTNPSPTNLEGAGATSLSVPWIGLKVTP